MAMANEEFLMDGLEKLNGILTGVAQKLDNLAESSSTSDGEITKLNAGKTDEEIRREDEIAAQITVPLVNALDSISAILNGATEEVKDMILK